MLTQLEARSSQGQLITFPLQDPSEGYLINDIEGLDPVKATIVTTDFAQGDGVQLQATKRGPRTIILKLDLVPDFTTSSVRSLRNRLYTVFMTESKVSLRFVMSDGSSVEIQGVVEDFSCPLFVKEPMASITIFCEKSDFYDPVVKKINGNTSTLTNTIDVDYEGSVETGIVFKLFPNRNIDNFLLMQTPPDGTLRQLDFETPTPLVANDVLEISTVFREKRAIRTRPSQPSTSVMFGVAPSSDWITLFQGVNRLRVYAQGAPIPFTIEYTDKFGGL